MLLSVIMVLSTMTFTLPVKVKAESKVLWEEDFDFELGEGEEYYDISTLRPDWVATIVDSDGANGATTGTFTAKASDSTITWADAATVHGPRVEFDGDKVILKKLRSTWNGNSNAMLDMPMTLNTDDGKHPTTGYTVFEYDYYTEAPFYKDRKEEWGAQDVILYNDASLRDYARLSITSTNGIQDLLDSPVPGDGGSYSSRYLSSYYDSYIADTNKNNIRPASDISGKTVHMQIVYDLENMKYMVSATVDGEKSFRENTWMDISDTVIGYRPLQPDIGWFIDKVRLTAAEAPQHGTGDSVASYDNMKYTHHTVLPEFVSSSVEEGDKDVPVSGTIDLTFSEDIDEASIDGISLKAGNTEADVTVAMDGTDGVTVTYEGLSGNVDYTLTVPETVTNVGGLPISAAQPITFTTEETVPAVTSVTPADNSLNQLLTVAPQVTFSEAVDEETIDGITLSDTYGNVAVTRALSADGKTVTLTPDSSLDAGVTYTVTVPATVKSLGGMAVSETTATFTTSTGGEVLWSENFDTITAENVMTERPAWTATVGNYSGGSLTSKAFNSSSENWSAAATDYTSKLAFENGKLVLGQKRNTEHGSENVVLNMPLGLSTSTGRPPATGYLVFEYDYYSDLLPVRDRYNERNNFNDLLLTESASGRTYAQIDITATNGIQDMHNAGTVNSADTYTSIAAGSAKNNVRRADDLQGKTVHMVLIFDVANTQYNIGAKVDGKYSFRSTDWVDYVGNQNAAWFFNKLTIIQNESNKGESTFTEATYDNFVLTRYTTLPAFVSHNIADTENVNVAGSFDLTFDTAIDPASIDAISLKADDAETAEEIELSMKDSKTVTVSYSGLSKLTPYTLTIPKIVVSNLGLPLSAAGTVSFTTNNIAPPEIENVTITDGATDVLLNKEIAVTLSEAIKEGTEQYITLTKKDEETNLITGYAVSNEDKTVTLAHADFEMNTEYVLTVPSTVKGVSDMPVEKAVYNFKTYESEVTATLNVSGDQVVRNTELQLTFTKTVSEASLGNITLTAGGVPVSVTPSLDGTKKIVTLDAMLSYATQYTVTIPAGMTSEIGIPIQAASFVFTTEAAPVEGTVLWSEDFTGITNENAGTELPSWTGTAYDYNGTRTTYNIAKGGDWTQASGEDLEGRVLFQNEKLILQDKLNCYDNGVGGTVVINMKKPDGTDLSIPSSGYAVFQFDYETENIISGSQARPTISMADCYGSGRLYGKLNIEKNYGISDWLPSGSTVDNRADNIRTATDIEGKVTKIQYVFDIANMKYMVSATVDGEKSFHGTDWLDYSKATSGVSVEATKGGTYYFNRVTINHKESYTGVNAFTSGIYDNFLYTHYTADKLPTFVSASLEDAATDVARTGEIDVVFSKDIDPASIGNITLAADGTPVDIDVVMNGDYAATIKYSRLAATTEYTLTVPKTVTDVNGLPLTTEQVITFTTNDVPFPEISDATITDGATGIAPNHVIAVTLSEAFKSGTEQYITLTKKGEYQNLITGYELSNENKTVTLLHADFDINSEYVLTVPQTVKGATSDVAVAEMVYNFKTIDSKVSAELNVSGDEVDVTAQLQLTFAETITDANIGNITLEANGVPVEITPTLDGTKKIVSLNNGTLRGNTTYVVTIPAGLVSESGIPVAEATFEFTTIVVPAPEVAGATVTDGAENILLDKVIAVTLSEPFKAGTEETITLTKKGEETNLITGYTLSQDNTVVTLAHADFEMNTEYVLTVPTTVISATTDLPIEEAVVYNFKTYESEVTATLNATGNAVAAGTALQLTFDRAINETGIENITLSAKGEEVEINPTLDGAVVSLNNTTLDYETEYTVTIPDGLTATNGIPVAEDTFTFTTKAFDPIIWEEDFSTLPEGVTADTSVESWYTDGWNAYIQNYGYTEGSNEFKFVDEKLQMTKGQDANTKGKGLIATKTITGAPTTGIVTLDYDFTISSAYKSDAYAPAMVVQNTDEQQLLALNFGASYSGICVNNIAGDGSVLSGTASAGGAPVASREFADSTSLDKFNALTDGNGTIHVRAIIDLDAKVYSLKLTKGGVEYTTPTAYIAIDPDITNFEIGYIAFQANNATTEENYTGETVVSTVDNIVLRYADPVVPTVTQSSVTNGAANVDAKEAIEVVFSTEMKESTLANVTLVKTEDLSSVTLTPSLAADCKTATFAFDTLEHETQYTLTIPVTVKSATGAPFASEVTYTFTTGELVEGTVLWSEDFTGLTNANVGTERPYWSGTVSTYIGGTKADINVSAGGNWTQASETEGLASRILFEDGKLVLQDKWNCYHNSIAAIMYLPFKNAQGNVPTIPGTGYAVFEFEYETENLATAPVIRPTVYFDDVANSGRKYGAMNISENYGISDWLQSGSTLENRANNIREAEDIEGKVTKIQYVFDIANMKYMVSATVDGKKSFNGTEWLDYAKATSGASVEATKGGQYYFNRVTLRQNDTYVGTDTFSTAKYDNFKYTHYTSDKLPAFVSASLADTATDVARTGAINVTFSKKLDPASISNITLMAGETPVDIEVVMNGNNAVTVKYSRLDANTTYTLTVPKTVTDFNGLPLTTEEVITFTTNDVPFPEISGATVADNATGIALNKVISITLSEAFDEDTIEYITLTVKDSDENLITGYQLSEGNTVVTLAHDNFALNTQYVLTVPDTVKGVSGMPVEETVYNFTSYDSEISATLNVDETNVPMDAQLQLTFAETITDTNIENITLEANGEPVASTPTLDGTKKDVSINNGK